MKTKKAEDLKIGDHILDHNKIPRKVKANNPSTPCGGFCQIITDGGGNTEFTFANEVEVPLHE